MRAIIITMFLIGAVIISCTDSGEGNPDVLIGKGGSLARFAVTPTHLYAVDNESLNVFQIMQEGGLEKINTVSIDFGVETIFAKGSWLYIGTTESMRIYTIEHPANPHFISAYSHFVACDPVVVQDTLAFVTVRTTDCRAADFNSLDIINIKDPQNPVLLSSYTLESPYGLGVDGNLLFICEGEYGLKVFDISDPYNIMLIKNFAVDAYDVIPNNNVLILTGKDGIVQYDYSDHTAIKKLSTIPVSL